jgi:hypothetical protein
MIDFEQYLARHGEFGVQAIIERWERYEGIRSGVDVPLKDRWMALMGRDGSAPARRQCIAA